MRDQLCTDFVPLHYGFGPEHMVSCADGMKPFTKELVFSELSSWMSLQTADTFWNKVKVIGVADGTNIYCEKPGGFWGNKELFSAHKLCALQKVMFLATTRGYIVCNNAGFGGSGKCSDKNLLDLILANDEEAVARDQGARNLISFFRFDERNSI